MFQADFSQVRSAKSARGSARGIMYLVRKLLASETISSWKGTSNQTLAEGLACPKFNEPASDARVATQLGEMRRQRKE